MTDLICQRILITGRVQGVGFRYWTRERAEEMGLNGWVRNTPEGQVEAVFSGPVLLVEEMIALCEEGPPMARVMEVERLISDEHPRPGFDILPTSVF